MSLCLGMNLIQAILFSDIRVIELCYMHVMNWTMKLCAQLFWQIKLFDERYALDLFHFDVCRCEIC